MYRPDVPFDQAMVNAILVPSTALPVAIVPTVLPATALPYSFPAESWVTFSVSVTPLLWYSCQEPAAEKAGAAAGATTCAADCGMGTGGDACAAGARAT